MVEAAVTAEGEEALAAAAAAAGRTAAGRTVAALTATKSWDNKPARSSSGLFLCMHGEHFRVLEIVQLLQLASV